MKKKEIKNLIIEYLEKHKGETVHPIDIANHYNLSVWKTFKIAQKMKKKGLIQYGD